MFSYSNLFCVSHCRCGWLLLHLITQKTNAVGRTSVNECSARRKKQMSMPPAGFVAAIPANEGPQACVSATVIGCVALRDKAPCVTHSALPNIRKWCRMFCENLIVSQLANIFTAFFGPKSFITLFATVLRLFLSSAKSIHSALFLCVYLKFILIYFSLLLRPSGFLIKILCAFLLFLFLPPACPLPVSSFLICLRKKFSEQYGL